MSKVYLFFRKEGFYPIELRDDECAAANGECNPGTLRIEDALTGAQVWPPKLSAAEVN